MVFVMDLLFIGGGGHYKDLLYVAENDKYTDWNVIGFLDDAEIEGRIGPINKLNLLLDKYKNLQYCISINSSDIRNDLDAKHGRLDRSANLIHETAVIGASCLLGNGVTMGPYSVLTTRVRVGNHTHINTLASINQNSSLGDYCTVSPGSRICGDVNIGNVSSLGAGSVVINFKNVGSNCIVGAGSVIIDDVPDGCTVVGVPGKVIKRK
jgi:acetyltransferase EpsM